MFCELLHYNIYKMLEEAFLRRSYNLYSFLFQNMILNNYCFTWKIQIIHNTYNTSTGKYNFTVLECI